MPSVAVASMPFFDLELLEHRARGDGLADDDVVPGQHVAALVEADAGAVQVHGTVVAALDVVLAAPQRAHRHVQARGAGGLGDLAGLDHVVARAHEAPAEAAARHLHMHRHLLGLEAQHARGRRGVQAGALGADPQLGARRRPSARCSSAAPSAHGPGRGRRTRLPAGAAPWPAAPCRRRRRAGPGWPASSRYWASEAFAVRLLHRGRVPLQLERVAPLLGRPVAVGHHGDTFATAVDRYAQHGLHALDSARRAVVHRAQAGAEHGRMRHHGGELAGQARVDAEVLSAAALGARIEARRGPADDPEVLRVPSA